MVIIADDREKERPAGRIVLQELGNPKELHLEAADYALFGKTTAGIEVVQIKGMLTDIGDGRLERKLIRCASDYAIVILIIEGLFIMNGTDNLIIQDKDFRISPYSRSDKPYGKRVMLNMDMQETGWNANSVKQELASLCLRYIHVIENTLSPQETADRINHWHRYILKGPSFHRPRSRPFAMNREKDVRAAMLMGIPGIDTQTIHNLIAHYHTIGAISSAREQDLKNIKGVGKVTARKIWNALHSGDNI